MQEWGHECPCGITCKRPCAMAAPVGSWVLGAAAMKKSEHQAAGNPFIILEAGRVQSVPIMGLPSSGIMTCLCEAVAVVFAGEQERDPVRRNLGCQEMEEEEEEAPMDDAPAEEAKQCRTEAFEEEVLPEESLESGGSSSHMENEEAPMDGSFDELPEEGEELLEEAAGDADAADAGDADAGNADTFEELEGGEVLEEVPKWLKNCFEQRREGRLALCLRRKLKDDNDAHLFCAELDRRIEEAAEKAETLKFEDFDISQNAIPTEHLETMFNSISSPSVHIERLRAFGIATFDDTAAILLSGWLQGVTASNVPHEMHLSDCALTAVGFRAIMDALTDNDVFPAADPRNPQRGQLPIYMRVVEGNYIESSALQTAVDNGVAITFTKTG
ncbi:unnamed protein product, partial [Symbiodinium necroappetens]